MLNVAYVTMKVTLLESEDLTLDGSTQKYFLLVLEDGGDVKEDLD